MRLRGCLFGFLIVMVLAIIAGALWWGSYTHSPQYSLFRATLAANTGDWNEVRAYVDVDAVTNEVAEIIVKQQVDDVGIELGKLGDVLASAAVPAVAQQLETQVRAEVVARHGRRNTPRQVLGAFYFANRAAVDVNGDQARVRVSLPILGKQRLTRLRMERAGPIWRVVAVENIAQLVKTK